MFINRLGTAHWQSGLFQAHTPSASLHIHNRTQPSRLNLCTHRSAERWRKTQANHKAGGGGGDSFIALVARREKKGVTIVSFPKDVVVYEWRRESPCVADCRLLAVSRAEGDNSSLVNCQQQTSMSGCTPAPSGVAPTVTVHAHPGRPCTARDVVSCDVTRTPVERARARVRLAV